MVPRAGDYQEKRLPALTERPWFWRGPRFWFFWQDYGSRSSSNGLGMCAAGMIHVMSLGNKQGPLEERRAESCCLYRVFACLNLSIKPDKRSGKGILPLAAVLCAQYALWNRRSNSSFSPSRKSGWAISIRARARSRRVRPFRWAMPYSVTT